MRKRVLLAEQSDAIRGVAETALRQNGFEVISVASSEKALEVLRLTRPDLIIMGGELTTPDQRPLYEKIRSDPKAGAIAILLLNDPGGELPFPPEIIIPRPFDPKEFLEKVMVFSGRAGSGKKQAVPNPLEQANLDDDYLDAALGIDHINVTDSEEMGKTATGAKNESGTPKSPDKFIGFDYVEKEKGKSVDSGKVESVMIRDSRGVDIKRSTQQGKRQPSPSASGKLDILTDQYGLTDPSALRVEVENQVHDYQWFIDEMRQEAKASPATSSPAGSSSDDRASSPDLVISKPASQIDPVTPTTGSPVSGIIPRQGKGGSVDRFLDEFKKEVEKFQSEEPET